MPQVVKKQYASKGGEWVEIAATVAAAGFPTGAVVPSSGVVPSEGWLLCDGSAVSVTTYPALFVVCGTRYGGDGVTTFNLPDLSGRVPVGAGDPTFGAVGAVGGEKEHLLTEVESGMKEHIHELPMANSKTAINSWDDISLRAGYPGPTLDAQFRTGTTRDMNGVGGVRYYGSGVIAKDAATPHNNIQPYLTLTYMIKT